MTRSSGREAQEELEMNEEELGKNEEELRRNWRLMRKSSGKSGKE